MSGCAVEVLDGRETLDEDLPMNRGDYQAVPTAQRFHMSDEFVRAIMGPIGSGKSVACTMEIIGRAMGQRAMPTPEWPAGVRRSRWAVIRNTYPELKSTTIKTWQDWLPESVAPFNWGTPITCRWIGVRDDDGTMVDLEVFFLAMDQPKDVKKLLSLELTGVWFNEAKEVSKSAIDMATGRVGRFPSKRDGGASWSGVILDTNPPDDDHWFYNEFELVQPDGWKLFKQPSALIKEGKDENAVYRPNPLCENVNNHSLGFDYWLRQIPGKKAEWIKVFVLGQYGFVADGKPVYPEFNENIHISPAPLQVYRGLPIILGWDFGLTPACIVMQLTPRGQLRAIREYIGDGIGIRQFAKRVVKPALALEFPNQRIISIGDPAGLEKSQANEVTCMEELEAADLTTMPARTQDPTARREAVAGFLTSLTPDGDPAYIVDPSCSKLIKGFGGGFRYRRVQVPGEERYQDKVDKNMFSHPHEAQQYGALHITMPGGGIKKTKRPVRREAYKPASSEAGY